MRSLVIAAIMVGMATTARAEGMAVPEAACPTADARDTIQSVITRATARLGNPVKSEVVEDQVIYTFKLKTGADYFVTLTREGGKLVVTCDAS